MSEVNNSNSNIEINETETLYGENRRTKRRTYDTKVNNNYKKYISIILCLLIIFVVSLLVFLFFKLKGAEHNLNIYYENSITNINDILPKLNLKENDYFPTKNQILESRELYISDKNLTPEYIQYFKTLSEKEEMIYKKKENEGKRFDDYFNYRENQYNYSDFYYLCTEEKLIDSQKIQPCYEPFISIILPSFNKANEILKSIRSIQNQ